MRVQIKRCLPGDALAARQSDERHRADLDREQLENPLHGEPDNKRRPRKQGQKHPHITTGRRPNMDAASTDRFEGISVLVSCS